MSKVKVFLGTHNHIPFGSEDEVFEKAYRLRFKPFIAALYRFPKIPATLHYSGALLHWMEKRHPEFIMILEEMVGRKQVELLGGGFYEPMFPLIPLADKIGQIEMLTTYLRKQFGRRPRGCWLPGMVWEQNLVGPLQTCGMDYVFLDEEQFRRAGAGGDAIGSPCLTEDQGKIIGVFPVSSSHGSRIGTMDPTAFFDRFAAGCNGGEGCVALFPDRFHPADPGRGLLDAGTAKKAAVPSDQELEQAVEHFLEQFARLDGSWEISTPSRFMKGGAISGKAYFPASAERRVSYWSAAPEKRGALERPADGESAAGSDPAPCESIVRQFLIRYPEANGIYSKMLYTHILINQLRGDKYRKRSAREEMWKAQGCDAFWHLGDGGIYDGGIRKSVYGALLSAEKITRERGVFIPSIVVFDFDLDGEREYLFQGMDLNCYVDTLGACVFELDYMPKNWNYMDTFARKKDGYNPDAEEGGYHRRSGFMDMLVPPGAAVADALEGKIGSSRFCGEKPYELVSLDRVHQEAVFRLRPDPDSCYGDIEIVKKIGLKKNVLSVDYTLINRGSRPERFNFIPQIDLSFSGEGPSNQRIHQVCGGEKRSVPVDSGSLSAMDSLVLNDVKNDVAVALGSNQPFEAWLAPYRTRFPVDGALADRYQSTAILPIKPLVLTPGESWSTVFTLRFGR